MKLLFFGFTCACVGMFAGLVSERVPVGFFSALAVWWLLLSIDAIVNTPHVTSHNAVVFHSNCEDEL